MQSVIRLVDPHGRIKATFDSCPSSEDLLRFALELGPMDSFIVWTMQPGKRSLAVLKAGNDSTPIPLGPPVASILWCPWKAMRTAMADAAWTRMVDAGWGAMILETSAETCSTP